MIKRDHSQNKLPKLANSDSTLSSKLYSLTGLRIFQAKFMEDLRQPKNNQKNMLSLNGSSQNGGGFGVSRPTTTVDLFTGKDKGNELKASQNANTGEGRLQNSRKIENAQKPLIIERLRPKCGRPRGLKNLGNTCYMNATLQSLFCLEQFNTALEKQIGLKKIDKSIANSYMKLVKAMRTSGEREVLTPSEFKNIIGKKKSRFDNNAQQDAQQLMTAFLQCVNQQTSRVKEKPKYQELQGDPTKQSVAKIAEDWWKYFKLRDDSVICDFFQGQTQSIIVCGDCGFKSVSFDNLWGLPVSLGKKSCDLTQILTSNLNSDQLLQDYLCGKCKSSKKCMKQSKIFRLPQILVIQLKRFGYGWMRKQKIKDRIQVPLELNLKSVLSEHSSQNNFTYRFRSCVQHSGELNFGHYTSHVYSQKDEKWFLSDDQRISADELQLDSSKLYLLIYQKK